VIDARELLAGRDRASVPRDGRLEAVAHVPRVPTSARRHADDAALIVGESLLERGDAAAARPWLERAARSPRESVRARAQRALQRAASPTSR
jgi:hypothetical protein